MRRALLVVGGVLNCILAGFHVWLGVQIHAMPGLAPGQRALMEMLNAGGTLMIVFFAIASLAFAREVLATRLGMLILGFVAALYLSRAIEEVLISPHFSAVIFGVCLAITGIYLALLVGSLRRPAGSTAD